MPSFNSFLKGLWGDSGLPVDTNEPDALNGSVDLEDIINEYDEPSRRSKNTSLLSNSTSWLKSQSYFSLSGTKEEETTSFYSALQDGFSLDEHDFRNKYGQEFLWNDRERDEMLNRPDFQVSWYDVTYTISPKPSIGKVWYELQKRISHGLVSIPRTLSCQKRSDSYTCNETGASNSVNRNTESLEILKNISGSFKSGELTAIMGPSGAGKTSLLNFLSRRAEEGFTGHLYVNETNHKIRINSIPQDDHLPEYLTVKENLIYASRLKNPYPNYDHEKNVYKVSGLLGLDECLDTRTKNISGGQQKRLAIAQELLSKPDILILDEPTSGLDSRTCFKTLSALKDLVKTSAKKIIDPIAIVVTIHQPQHETFNLFDKVYVMANGGIAIYDGAPQRVTQFIEEYSGIQMSSSDRNPASFLIEIASGEYGREPIEALERQVRLEFEREQEKIGLKLTPDSKDVNISGNNNKTTRNGALFNGLDRGSPLGKARKQLHLDTRLTNGSIMNKGSFFLKTRILTKRCWISMVRDPKQMIARILFHILLPFIMAFMMGTEPGHANACPEYQQEYSLKELLLTDKYTSQRTQEEFLLTLENTGTLFVTIYSSVSANIAAITLLFNLDMKSSLKEFYNGWYRMESYVIARLLSTIPLNVVLPITTIALMYVFTEQNTGNGETLPDVYRVMITSLAVIVGLSIGQLIGMIFAAIYVGHITTALFASQGATLPFVLLSGFVVRTKYMSKFVYFLSMTSLFKHCLEATFIARYGYNVCECDPSKITGKDTVLTGVSEDLQSFTRYWMNSQQENDKDIPPGDYNSTHKSSDDKDVFQLAAKQISYYNTYGIDVKSCDQVRPYQLYDFQLLETDLPRIFSSLIISWLTMALLLFVTVRIVVSYKTSL